MPILNKRERVEAIMRYIHKHRHEINTSDSLAKALDIPIATLRKTLTKDYPECFNRDPRNYRNVTLSGAWPDFRKFDLDPKPPAMEPAQSKLNPAHLETGQLNTLNYITPQAIELLFTWVDTGIAGKQAPPKEYWTLMNTLNYMQLMLKLVRSSRPRARLSELVDLTKGTIPSSIEKLINQLEATEESDTA